MELDYLQALMGGTLQEESPAASFRDIWVVAETRRGRLAVATLEILGRAREMADMLGVRVACVIMGHDVSALATGAIACGADRVFVGDAQSLAARRGETHLAPLADLIVQKKPEIVLLSATTFGRDLAPRLAVRLKTGLLSECIALDIDESERLLLGTRAIYNGILLNTVTCPVARPQMATVLPGYLRSMPADPYRQGTVEQMDVDSAGEPLSKIERAQAPKRDIALGDARVIVAGGRGMGGPEGFAQLEELAGLLRGVVAASRSAVEFGWAPRQRMVDIAGNAVHPDLYIAVGISGAFPHRIAIRGTRCLIAINKEAKAAIFDKADFGIIGDWREVLPALIAAIKEASEA